MGKGSIQRQLFKEGTETGDRWDETFGGASNCLSCNAPIFWLKTVNDKPIPIDREPVKGGNIVIANRKIAEVVKADPDVLRYVSHCATCPDAKKWRKK